LKSGRTRGPGNAFKNVGGFAINILDTSPGPWAAEFQKHIHSQQHKSFDTNSFSIRAMSFSFRRFPVFLVIMIESPAGFPSSLCSLVFVYRCIVFVGKTVIVVRLRGR
jgi:hypothetical protein